MMARCKEVCESKLVRRRCDAHAEGRWLELLRASQYL